MSRLHKELDRLKSKPKDFTYDEARYVLNKLGFYEDNKGKTSGSRVVYKNNSLNKKIELHKPHPGNILKEYQINQIISSLNEWEVLQ